MRASKPRRRPGEDEVLELESDWLNKNLDEDLAVLRSSSHSLPLAPKLALLEQSLASTTVVDSPPSAVTESSTVLVEPPADSEADPAAPVPGPTTTGVPASATSGHMSDFWQAETLGILFPARRVRRLTNPKEALTAPEKSVYDLLWESSPASSSTSVRLARIGYDRIARATGVTKRNAALILERLIDKRFIEIASPGDATTAREYRVFDLQSAFGRLQSQGRNWIVRSGNGVLFVHRVSASIQRASP